METVMIVSVAIRFVMFLIICIYIFQGLILPYLNYSLCYIATRK